MSVESLSEDAEIWVEFASIHSDHGRVPVISEWAGIETVKVEFMCLYFKNVQQIVQIDFL